MTSLRDMTIRSAWCAALLVAGTATAVAQEAPPTEGAGLASDAGASAGARDQPTEVQETDNAHEGPPAARVGAAAMQAGSSVPGIEIRGVQANGSGCAGGTWHATHSGADANGDPFVEISFDEFGLSLDPTSASVKMKNCQLWIDLGSDRERMLAVREFTFSGVRSLGPGQLARVATDLGWSGQLPSKNGVTFIGPTAPGDESFSFTDRRAEDNFSSCDTQARLIVNVSANLSATSSDAHPPSSGYLQILQARSDGSPSEVRLAMTARDCDATGEEK